MCVAQTTGKILSSQFASHSQPTLRAIWQKPAGKQLRPPPRPPQPAARPTPPALQELPGAADSAACTGYHPPQLQPVLPGEVGVHFAAPMMGS